MDKSIFSKFVARIRTEGILKSLLYGLINGFAVNFLLITVFYLISVYSDSTDILSLGLWLSIGLGVAVGVLTGVIIYFTKLRPTTKRVAERVDSLGLEERLITMLEFEKDESYIAMKQREDAKVCLNKVDTKAVKFNFAKSVIIAAAVLTVFGLSMTTVGALTTFNVIDPINPPIEIDNTEYVEVTYLTEGDGTIFGYDPDANTIILDSEESYDVQLVPLGGDAMPIVAYPDEGWAFAGWMFEDGTQDEENQSPIRTDKEIPGKFTVIAVFEEAEGGDGEGGPGGGSDTPPEEGENPPPPADENAPPSEGGGEPDNKKDDGSDPNEGDPSQSDPGDPDKENENPDSDQVGGNDRLAQSNKFRDGETPYTDEYDMWNEEALRQLLENPNLTPEQRELAEAYLKNLGAGVATGSDSGEE